MLGLCYSFVGNYKDSVNCFIELNKINPNDKTSYMIATIFYKMGDYDSSKIYLENIIDKTESKKTKEEAYLLLGERLFKEKERKKALVCFYKILEINEYNAMAYFYKGEIIYHTENNISLAKKFWSEAGDIEPANQLVKDRLRIR
jgi:tetratricopeptide (TPR) repeat protein